MDFGGYTLPATNWRRHMSSPSAAGGLSLSPTLLEQEWGQIQEDSSFMSVYMVQLESPGGRSFDETQRHLNLVTMLSHLSDLSPEGASAHGKLEGRSRRLC